MNEVLSYVTAGLVGFTFGSILLAALFNNGNRQPTATFIKIAWYGCGAMATSLMAQILIVIIGG